MIDVNAEVIGPSQIFDGVDFLVKRSLRKRDMDNKVYHTVNNSASMRGGTERLAVDADVGGHILVHLELMT